MIWDVKLMEMEQEEDRRAAKAASAPEGTASSPSAAANIIKALEAKQGYQKPVTAREQAMQRIAEMEHNLGMD